MKEQTLNAFYEFTVRMSAVLTEPSEVNRRACQQALEELGDCIQQENITDKKT